VSAPVWQKLLECDQLHADGASDGALPAGCVSETLEETAFKRLLLRPEVKFWAEERTSRLASVSRNRSQVYASAPLVARVDWHRANISCVNSGSLPS
jgi:hypothetical protein